jgi:signal transduction histidine kinase
VAAVGVRLSWRRSTDGMLIATSVVLGTLFGMNDWALQSNLMGPESWYLGPYANLVNFGVFCLLMFRHYIRAVRAVHAANEVLAQRLSAKEEELRSSYERLREVERMQTLADERQRLTQDMHDGLGSSLHTALRAVQRGRADPEAVADILRGCIDELYLTIDSMEPAQTDLLVLLGTLRHRLAPRLQQAGVTLEWAVNDVPDLPWLDPRRALHILRIVQEALSNSLRHAGASTLRLSTAVEGDAVCVRLSDNGQGFDVQQALSRGGRGLQHQRRRAEAIGGRITWHSAGEGGGATTTLWLPLIPVKVEP